MGWLFILRIREKTPEGVLVTLCLLCQRQMLKKTNIIDIVEKHIGGEQCGNITAQALGVYNLLLDKKTHWGGTWRAAQVLNARQTWLTWFYHVSILYTLLYCKNLTLENSSYLSTFLIFRTYQKYLLLEYFILHVEAWQYLFMYTL